MSFNEAPIRRKPPILDDTQFKTLTTLPSWSDGEKNPLFDHQTTKTFYLTDENGKKVIDENGEPIQINEKLIALYSMFTADIRLANLSKEELDFVREHLDLAHDCMASGYKKGAMVILERAISVNESSHSKSGWFREKLGTITTEQKQEYSEPKKSFLGGKK